MSIIAIDYGQSKCGYAIGTIFVSESGTLPPKQVIEKAKKCDKVVVGLPLSMSGNYSTQTFQAIDFAMKILYSGKEVYLLDERLTTQMAKTFGKKDDDRFSAEQLLLDYINSNASSIRLCIKKSNTNSLTGNQTILVENSRISTVEVPTTKEFNINNKEIAFATDPYIAYTNHKSGFMVFRNFDDFLNNLDSGDVLIVNKVLFEKYRNFIEKFDIILVDVEGMCS